jgi:hypothetical protein
MRALAILLLSASVGSAHDWYPPKCCSGKDCAPVASDAISCDADGCDLTLIPGQHPMIPADFNGGQPVTVHTTKQPQFSPDGQNHACVGRTLVVFCLFVGGAV